jgi:flagellar basal-body rod modification protein FlgD
MDIVNATQSAGASSAANISASSSKASLDYNSFLQLLIAQMKNQDPLNPVNSTEYVSQLASFSTVEQAIQTNTKLDNLLGSMTLAQAGSVIGRTVTSADGRTTGEVTSVRITSEGAVAQLDGGGSVTIAPGITIS